MGAYLIANIMPVGSIRLQMFLVELDPFWQIGFFEPLQEGWSIFFGRLDDIVDQEDDERMGRAQVHLDEILLPKVLAQ
jgi:hypothetical protein